MNGFCPSSLVHRLPTLWNFKSAFILPQFAFPCRFMFETKIPIESYRRVSSVPWTHSSYQCSLDVLFSCVICITIKSDAKIEFYCYFPSQSKFELLAGGKIRFPNQVNQWRIFSASSKFITFLFLFVCFWVL